ncbi:ankyrin and het domain-containing protein [Colletotrichum asianum]
MDVRYLAASYLGYFSASTGQRLNLEALLRDPDPNVLVADGVILDVVTRTVTLGVGEEKRSRAFKRIDPQSMDPRPAGSSQFQAFFETMVFDNVTFHRGFTADENLRRLAIGFLREINTFYYENEVHHKMTTEDFEKLGVIQSDLFKSAVEEYQRLEATDPDELHWRREEYTLRTEEVTNGSLTKIFSTESDYVGRGLISIEDGDLVAILFGCELPVILRKCGEQPAYQLISPCYVSGIMNGEVMGYSRFKNPLETSFVKVESLRLV